MRFDMIVKGGSVVTPGEGVMRADVAVRGGKVAALIDDAAGAEADDVYDASGLHVFPGVVDPPRPHRPRRGLGRLGDGDALRGRRRRDHRAHLSHGGDVLRADRRGEPRPRRAGLRRRLRLPPRALGARPPRRDGRARRAVRHQVVQILHQLPGRRGRVPGHIGHGRRLHVSLLRPSVEAAGRRRQRPPREHRGRLGVTQAAAGGGARRPQGVGRVAPRLRRGAERRGRGVLRPRHGVPALHRPRQRAARAQRAQGGAGALRRGSALHRDLPPLPHPPLGHGDRPAGQGQSPPALGGRRGGPVGRPCATAPSIPWAPTTSPARRGGKRAASGRAAPASPEARRSFPPCSARATTGAAFPSSASPS